MSSWLLFLAATWTKPWSPLVVCTSLKDLQTTGEDFFEAFCFRLESNGQLEPWGCRMIGSSATVSCGSPFSNQVWQPLLSGSPCSQHLGSITTRSSWCWTPRPFSETSKPRFRDVPPFGHKDTCLALGRRIIRKHSSWCLARQPITAVRPARSSPFSQVRFLTTHLCTENMKNARHLTASAPA